MPCKPSPSFFPSWTVRLPRRNGFKCFGMPLERIEAGGARGLRTPFRNLISSASYASLLRDCGSRKDLPESRLLHAAMVGNGLGSNLFLCNHLIQAYHKCGSLSDALHVFLSLPARNHVSWNIMIAGYAKNGQCTESMALFLRMLQEGFKPNKITFINLLSGCASLHSLSLGKIIHAYIFHTGLDLDVSIRTSLLSMYCRSEDLEKAISMFDRMSQRDLVSWNTMISALSQHGHESGSFKLFRLMEFEGLKPSKPSCIAVLNAFSSSPAIPLGKLVHAYIVDNGMNLDITVATALFSMYSRCGSVVDAREMFSKIPNPDVVAWNAMIACYVHHDCNGEAFQLFHQMQQESLKPSNATYVSLLAACTVPSSLAYGRMIHAGIIHSELESDIIVGNALVCMYGRCANVKDAQRMFDKMSERDVVTWSSIINIYAGLEDDAHAFKLFQQMQQEGVKPNNVTFITLLNSCICGTEAVTLGKLVHAQIIGYDIESIHSVGNALISMYSKCGSISSAWEIFNQMRKRDVVSWNAMLSGFLFCNRCGKAFELFLQMEQEGENPNKVTFIIILDVCAKLSALAHGRLIHAHIVDRGMELDVDVGTALINMYSKCGSVQDARFVFDEMPRRDVVSWSAIIETYAHHGWHREVIELFEEMQMECVTPNEVTWAIFLSACSHAGFLNEGMHYFNSFIKDCGNILKVEHCNCIVDLLSRAGWLDEAEAFINKMPIQPNAVTWMTLLCSCRLHGCNEWGKYAVKCILQLNPHLSSAYVMLSNVHAASGQWVDAAESRNPW